MNNAFANASSSLALPAASRRGFMRTGGALSAVAVSLLAGNEAMAAGMKGDMSKDVSILNVALALEHEAINAYQLGAGSGLLQKPVLDLLSQKATAVLTNVPGPQKPLYLAGSRMKEMMFWVPQNGNIGLGISILSYNGKVFFGLISDYRLLPNPSEVINRFSKEFEKLLYLGMMLPLEGRPDPEAAKVLLDSMPKDI